MFDSITDKLKVDGIEKEYLLSSEDIDFIIHLIDSAENFSEEIGYHTRKSYKDNLKVGRNNIYNAIIEKLYQRPFSLKR